MVSKSEVYHNLIGQREDAILDSSHSVEGYATAYSFLDSALNEENDFESWLVDILSYTGKEREDGVEEGRVKLDSESFLLKSTWKCYDFQNDNLKKGDANALKQNYEGMTGNSDFSGGYSTADFRSLLKILSDAFDKNNDVVKEDDKNNSTNLYEFEITREEIRDVYECLDTVFFPSKEQVEKELDMAIGEGDEIVEKHVRNFPYASNKHVSQQIEADLQKIIDERNKILENWEGHTKNEEN